jgi:hypothetical protein
MYKSMCSRFLNPHFMSQSQISKTSIVINLHIRLAKAAIEINYHYFYILFFLFMSLLATSIDMHKILTKICLQTDKMIKKKAQLKRH